MLLSEINSIFCATTFAIPKGENLVTFENNSLIAPNWGPLAMCLIIRFNDKQLNVVGVCIVCSDGINALCTATYNKRWLDFDMAGDVNIGDIATAYDSKFHNELGYC